MEEGREGGKGMKTRRDGKEGGKGQGREEGREGEKEGEVCSEKLRGAVSCGNISFKMSLEQGHTCLPPPHLHPN